MWFDGDDDEQNDSKKEPDVEAGDYNIGDELTKAGEGHDPIEDEVT